MKKKGLKEKLHLVKLGILASIPEAVAFCSALVTYAAEASDAKDAIVAQKVNNTSMGLWGTMKLVSISLLVIALSVCGIVLMIGTQKMKDGIKEHFYSIAIGVMILFLAKDIAEYCENVFG